MMVRFLQWTLALVLLATGLLIPMTRPAAAQTDCWVVVREASFNTNFYYFDDELGSISVTPQSEIRFTYTPDAGTKTTEVMTYWSALGGPGHENYILKTVMNCGFQNAES